MIAAPRRMLVAGLAGLALVLAPAAAADLADEQALAERFAPVVRLVEQDAECGPGEPYDPLDVELLLASEPTVALPDPGPDRSRKIGLTAADLVNRFEYHLDFPGNPSTPSATTSGGHATLPREARRPCTRTSRRRRGTRAHSRCSTGSSMPSTTSTTRTSDWEMIQLVFDAGDARGRSRRSRRRPVTAPTRAERATWGDDKLELVDETHPVVFPGAGSHANKFTEALYLGSSAEAGVGCDDTRGRSVASSARRS